MLLVILQLLEKLWSTAVVLIRRWMKFQALLLTGKGELHRICDAGWHTSHMTQKVARSLRLSRQLKSLCEQTIFQPTVFEVNMALGRIVEVKRIGPDCQLVKSNLEQCLAVINYVNAIISKALALKGTTYNSNDASHERLLDSVWESLKPDMTRKGGRLTSEWGEIGFQGKDPATDFRGMGLLGLAQLQWFCQNRGSEAREILVESNHPQRYYPFAITGINISSFILSLLEERLLDDLLFHTCEKDYEQHRHKPPAQDQALIEQGMIDIHRFYGDVFVEFNRQWVLDNPANVLAFPGIFNKVKVNTRSKLLSQRGDYNLTTMVS